MDKSARRHPNVVNLTEVKPGGFEKGERFTLTNKALGRATGARGIGDSLDYYDGEL